MAKISRTEAKKQLIKKCEDLGAGNQMLTFSSNRMSDSIKPKSDIYYKEHFFRLRYSDRFDSPFEDDQPEDYDVRLPRPHFNEYELHTSPMEKCLQMHLILHKGNINNSGNRFKLENKELDAQEELLEDDLLFSALSKVRDCEYSEAMAVYAVLFGHPGNVGIKEARAKLNKYAKNGGFRQVLAAFDDDVAKIKYNYEIAVNLGYLVTDEVNKTIRFSKAKEILTNAKPNETLQNRFVNFVIKDEEGQKAYEELTKQLNS